MRESEREYAMRWLVNIIFTLLLMGGFAGVAYLYADYTLQSPIRSEDVIVEIPPNSSVKTVGSILKEKNLIRDDLFFRYYAKWKGQTNILAGPYLVKKGDNLDDILSILTSGKQDTVKVTIIEGSTAIEMAEIFHKLLGTSKDAFLKEVNRTNGKFEFEKNIPVKPEIKYKLEGYLFPSTYQFRKGETPKKIVDTMLGKFEQEMENLKAFEMLQQNGKSLHELVTFASILEREGQRKDELPKIAGVIQNRLSDRMRLQVDASIVYAIQIDQGKKLKQVMKADYKYKSPFNTYEIYGLPPGAIGSPGVNAYKAALSPEKHKFLYYVLKEDGTGYHEFTTNYQAHLQADRSAKSRR